MRNTDAVCNAVIPQPACNLGAPAEKPERSALGQQAATCSAAAFIGQDVYNASDSVRAIQRRTRPTQHFQPVDIGNDEVADQARCIALWRSHITQALPIDQNSGVLISEATGL